MIREQDDHLALGELEMVFAIDLLSWLCKQHIIGSITLRNALLAIRPPPASGDRERAKGSVRPSLRDGGAS